MPVFVVAYDRDAEQTLALEEFGDEGLNESADRLGHLVAEHVANPAVEVEAIVSESREAFQAAFPQYARPRDDTPSTSDAPTERKAL